MQGIKNKAKLNILRWRQSLIKVQGLIRAPISEMG